MISSETAGRVRRAIHSNAPRYSDDALCEMRGEIMAVMQLRLLCVGAALAAGDATACQVHSASQAFNSPSFTGFFFSPHTIKVHQEAL